MYFEAKQLSRDFCLSYTLMKETKKQHVSLFVTAVNLRNPLKHGTLCRNISYPTR